VSAAVMKSHVPPPVPLSEQARAEIDLWVAKYPPERKQSAVMAALSIVQQEHGGSLTTELMDAVARYLGIPRVAVYEVASFYSMYERKPVGRHVLCLCTNVSCMLCGSEDIVKHLEGKFGIRMGETTPDGRFTLKEVECLAACGGAPAMMVGRTYYENLTPEKIDAILEDLGPEDRDQDQLGPKIGS
jgi:NADH-quinone oxidoreductase subunit E